jgi:hypothetical protein
MGAAAAATTARERLLDAQQQQPAAPAFLRVGKQDCMARLLQNKL